MRTRAEIHAARVARALEVVAMRREGLTLKAIGERLGVTRERVRQIEAFGERRARLARVVSGKAD